MCEALRTRERTNARLGGLVASRRAFAPEVRARVAADRDVIEPPRLDAGVLEAPARRERRKAGAVLDAIEALLLRRRDELAVDDEGGGRVAVIGVEAEDRRHGSMLGAASRSAPVMLSVEIGARPELDARGAPELEACRGAAAHRLEPAKRLVHGDEAPVAGALRAERLLDEIPQPAAHEA